MTTEQKPSEWAMKKAQEICKEFREDFDFDPGTFLTRVNKPSMQWRIAQALDAERNCAKALIESINIAHFHITNQLPTPANVEAARLLNQALEMRNKVESKNG